MSTLNESRKFQEYTLPLKNVPINIEDRLSLVNKSILEGASCIITYHRNVNLLRIKLFDGNNSSFSDLKISCTLLQDYEEVSTMLFTGNLLASFHGILQFSLANESALQIKMYNPEDDIQAERFQQVIHAIK